MHLSLIRYCAHYGRYKTNTLTAPVGFAYAYTLAITFRRRQIDFQFDELR